VLDIRLPYAILRPGILGKYGHGKRRNRMNLPAKFQKRVLGNLKKYQNVISALKLKDANESDTVMVITDILSDIFGYDKYSEITD
jgi:hypothetical protein